MMAADKKETIQVSEDEKKALLAGLESLNGKGQSLETSAFILNLFQKVSKWPTN